MSIFSRKSTRTAYVGLASSDGGPHTLSFTRDTLFDPKASFTTYASREEAERVAADLLRMFPNGAASVYRAR